MTLEPPTEDAAERLNRVLTVVLMRSFSLFLFALGLLYWGLIVGIAGPDFGLAGPVPRFDLMPVWWKVAAPTLAVLYPIAGTGLWMTARWGPVVWALVVLVEGVMHFGYPDLFGSRMLVLSLHICGVGLLGALRLALWRQRSRANKTA